MDKAEILKIVLPLLGTSCSFPIDRMVSSTSLRDELGVGSLEILEVGLQLEQELGIATEDGTFAEVTTIGDIVDVAHQLLARRESP